MPGNLAPPSKTAAKRACLACRARKVKCTPATPRCIRCARLGIDECLYVPVKKRGIGNILGMREACQRCRKKKQVSRRPPLGTDLQRLSHYDDNEQRCDAKHPCTPCIKLEMGSDCVYEQSLVTEGVHEEVFTTVQPPSGPSADGSSSLVDGKDASLSTSHIGDSVFFLTSSSHVPPRESRSPESDAPDESDPPTAQEISNSKTQLVPFQEGSPKPHQSRPTTIPAFAFLPSLRFLPQLHTPLGPEYLQVSDTSSSELDLSFRITTLRRLRRFGVYLTGPKQDAVMRGDTSNTIVHPFFIPAAAGLGMHLRPDAGHSPIMVRLHAKHAQLAFEQVAEISKGNDAILKAQVFFYVAATSFYAGSFGYSRQYLTKACIALNAAKLRFVPAAGRPPELTEDVYEGLVVLSQIIYFENYMFLAVDGIEPKMTVRIEKEFRHELQETYPHLFEICPLTVRTQGILLVRDTILLITLCSTDGTKPRQWKQIYDELVVRLDEYSDTLLRNARRFIEIGDSLGAEIVQSSCVGCLAHLAVLCDLVSRSEPHFKPQMDAVCDSSLERLGRLTEEMSLDEYTYLDLLLRISWERSLAAFDSRISYLSYEESASLRRSRKTVAEAWSDIDARLPEQSPLTLIALSVSVDGREQGSRYPNFLLPSERGTWGL